MTRLPTVAIYLLVVLASLAMAGAHIVDGSTVRAEVAPSKLELRHLLPGEAPARHD